MNREHEDLTARLDEQLAGVEAGAGELECHLHALGAADTDAGGRLLAAVDAAADWLEDALAELRQLADEAATALPGGAYALPVAA